ncbi:MAG: phage holin family protein [Actinomycetota bacterium]|nr:phage holin family protein [Actinomycetota bacterium]
MSDRPTNSDLYRGGDPSKKSVGQLVKEISEDFSTLFRKEVELAKAELGSSVSAKIKGVVTIAIAALFAFFALIFLLLAVRDGLDTFLWTWVADLVTALILILVGVGAVLFARKKLATPISADLTKETVKEDIEWAKSLKKR